jgi:hypothetical protein
MFATDAETRSWRLVFPRALGALCAPMHSSSSRILADKCSVACGHFRQGQLGEEVFCDIWPLWSRGSASAPRRRSDEVRGERSSSRARGGPLAAAADGDVVQRASQSSTTANATKPCRMAAQPPADPPWAICNHGPAGFLWPRPDQIGNRRPRMDAVIQKPIAKLLLVNHRSPAAATPTSQVRTIVFSSS